MKIVIEVPDEFYNKMIYQNGMSVCEAETVVNAFYRGTPLPKGQGRSRGMTELTFDIVELVLKEVRNSCIKNKECKGCQFQEITMNERREWYSCRISGEPHMWTFADKEGAEDDTRNQNS